MRFLVILILAIIALSSSTYATKLTGSNIECEFCGFLVSYVEGLAQKNASEAYITKELEKVCKFTGSLQPTCDSIIGAYTGEIIQMVFNKEPASVICAQIGICTSSKKVEEPKNLGTLECTICGFLVEKLEGYIQTNKSEAEIVKELNKACSAFGGLAATCTSIVDNYVPQLITLLNNSESPSTVCAQVGLCSSSKAAATTIDTGARRHIRKNTIKFL